MHAVYVPHTPWTWTFFLVVLVQALLGSGLEAYVFAQFQRARHGNANVVEDQFTQSAKAIPVFVAIFIFGFVYQVGLTWDGLRMKNTIQVIGLCLYNLGMMTYSVVQRDQVSEAYRELGARDLIDPTFFLVNPALIAVPCILALVTLVCSVVAWKLYGEFAWSIYKHISADLRLKRRFLAYQIYIALLKFDFFFVLGFAIQWRVLSSGTSKAEQVLTIAAIPITVVFLFLAAWFVRRESYAGHAAVIVLYLAAIVYFSYKLNSIYNPVTIDNNDGESTTQDVWRSARRSMTTFAVLTILMLVVTIGTALQCMRNFKKGLRPHIEARHAVPDSTKAAESGEAGPATHAMGAVPSRMTID